MLTLTPDFKNSTSVILQSHFCRLHVECFQINCPGMSHLTTKSTGSSHNLHTQWIK